jgi:hypothetical protein
MVHLNGNRKVPVLIFFRPDGKKYAGMWKNGKQHGDGSITMPNGETKEGVWQDGKQVK